MRSVQQFSEINIHLMLLSSAMYRFSCDTQIYGRSAGIRLKLSAVPDRGLVAVDRGYQ